MALKTTVTDNDEVRQTPPFNGVPIRYLQIGTQEWFAAKDICTAIGYKNTHLTIKRLHTAEDKALRPRFMAIPTARSGYQRTALITIQAVAYLCEHMNHPAAKRMPEFLCYAVWDGMIDAVYDAVIAGKNTVYAIFTAHPYHGIKPHEIQSALDAMLDEDIIDLTASGKYVAKGGVDPDKATVSPSLTGLITGPKDPVIMD